ncbi:U-box domain-containing protein 21-like [Nicotiana tabacum]|uniref:U-box domain-containing protein n=2 Tax=Nicotiana TaxID=4085 RepID=A0A1S4B6Z8_TOBAC|nr:PREDICTED: U-box domain-containing protein 21-like [Nicotiana sylvestris]XP_016484725.1 PREDICTED: U-box domain-containing protein 21-like [Nicotiana tabacum]
MIFWRRRKDKGAGKKKISRLNSCKELTIPSHFLCPISLDLMKDPVTLCTGISYDRENIEKWMEARNSTCPVTNQVLRNYDLIPNHTIRKMIQDWCVENKNYGIERVPTPRIPINSSQVSEICSRLMVETQRGNEKKCRELVGRIKILAKESERNKKCIVECGTGSVFAACFEKVSVEICADLLKDLLCGLIWMFPIGEEGKTKLGSAISLRCMAWFLKGEDLSARQNAVIVMKELLSYDQSYANDLMEIQDLAESLFQMVKVPICPSTTKASLMLIYSMVLDENSNKVVAKFVNMGLVSLVLEILVDAEKDIAEKALAVLDCFCNFQEGKEKAYDNGLTMPLIAKKIMRVSQMATECSISVLWKLCKSGHEISVIEALELGVFQKLLVVLQVGCAEKTKEKATELLKLMNIYKDRVDCFDVSTGFKYLKRSY